MAISFWCNQHSLKHFLVFGCANRETCLILTLNILVFIFKVVKRYIGMFCYKTKKVMLTNVATYGHKCFITVYQNVSFPRKIQHFISMNIWLCVLCTAVTNSCQVQQKTIRVEKQATLNSWPSVRLLGSLLLRHNRFPFYVFITAYCLMAVWKKQRHFFRACLIRW